MAEIVQASGLRARSPSHCSNNNMLCIARKTSVPALFKINFKALQAAHLQHTTVIEQHHGSAISVSLNWTLTVCNLELCWLCFKVAFDRVMPGGVTRTVLCCQASHCRQLGYVARHHTTANLATSPGITRSNTALKH